MASKRESPAYVEAKLRATKAVRAKKAADKKEAERRKAAAVKRVADKARRNKK